MEYSDKNEHLNDDPLENINENNEAPPGESEKSNLNSIDSDPEPKKPDNTNTDQNASLEGDNSTLGDQPDIVPVENDSPEKSQKKSSRKKSPPEELKKDEAVLSDEKKEDEENVPVAKGKGKEGSVVDTKDDENEAGGADEVEKEGKKPEKIKKGTKIEIAKENINYELLSKTDLVKTFEDLLNNSPFDQLRSDVEKIQEAFQKKYDQEFNEKKNNFLEAGGLEQDFKPIEDPDDKQMADLNEKYRILKSDYSRQLEEIKETNLTKKQEILEEFRLLMEGQEGFENTFRKFKQLQNKWFEAGIVPKQNVKDLWNSYNYFVDKFNDYVNINRELRALDLKKNLELKIKLCEKAEELATENNVALAFKVLQKYHAQWREIGPVPREDKDAIWERFKIATALINKAHQNFQADMKDALFENLEKKIKLCETIEQIAAIAYSNHGEWNSKTNEILAIQKEWKTIGYAPKKDNNTIYSRFRKACDQFFEKKAAFYAETFEHQKENLERKKEIIETAKVLKDSTDWKTTTDKLIDLQNKWKEIGPVPRKESDKLWKQFRSACDQFFSNKSEFFSGKNESYETNLKAKEALIQEILSFKPVTKRSELIAAMEDFQNRYNEIGFVPVEVKDKIRDDFQEALNSVIEKFKASDSDKALIRYRIKVASILNNPKADSKLRFERDKLMNKLQQLKNDIGVWENNIGFFKQTESAEDTISEFSEKLEDAKKRIEVLEKKINIIDQMEDGN